ALRAGQTLSKLQLQKLFGEDDLAVLYSSVKATELGDVRAEDLLKFLYGDGEAIAKALPDLQLPDKAVASRAEEPGSPSISPRSRTRTEQDIEKFGCLMEMSKTQEALEEYQAMARDLAEEFQEKVSNPNAEAFIEQLCVEKILQGCLFVGHVKTDLDSVAGALGAAALWRGTAARAEKELNGEIMYALKWAGIQMPPYFDDIPGAVKPNDKGEMLSICLVDHNEDKQMVPVLRDDPNRKKRIVGLIDHHALAESMASEKPLFMDVRPWGSMSSIIAHSFIRGNRMIPKPIARILLSAILSDTLNLQSVTTTNADRFIVTVLCILGECEDPDELARKMFRAKTEWIVGSEPQKWL
ncbi:ppaC, partial [Symbiodinium sp. KB8]